MKKWWNPFTWFRKKEPIIYDPIRDRYRSPMPEIYWQEQPLSKLNDTFTQISSPKY